MNIQRDPEFDAALRERLEKLRETPARSPEAVAHGRADYLAKVQQLTTEMSAKNKNFAAQTVAVSGLQRFNRWAQSIFSAPVRPKRLSLAVALATFVLTVMLLITGAGVTVYAAQSSLPNDFLYPLKIISEDVVLDLTSDPQARFDLLLDYSDRRVNEIVSLAQAGKVIPDEVIARLEAQDDSAFLLFTKMDASQQPASLLKAMIHKQNQDRDLGKIRANAPEHGAMLELQKRLQKRWSAGTDEQNGQQNPQELTNDQIETGAEPTVSPDRNEEQPGPGDCLNCTPVDSGSGPGPGAGPGPGPGPGPVNQGELTQPTEGYGPGSGSDQSAPQITPSGNENGEVGPSGSPAGTPVPGESGSGSGGETSPKPDPVGGDHDSGGGGGRP